MLKGRKSCLGGDPCQPRTLAEAISCCVHHSALTPRQIAERLGVRVGYLLDAANPDREDHAFQSKHLIPLMDCTGNWLPLAFMAQELGGIVLPIPAVDPDPSDFVNDFLTTAARLGESGDVIHRAMRDGCVTEVEAREIHTAATRLMTAGAAIWNRAKARLRGFGGES